MSNTEFELLGVNHLALVCKDMARTVDFYTNVLGMKMIKTIELPNNMGQHFFFDMGNGDSMAFFWFPNAPEAAPGVASATPGVLPGPSAHGSMNHIAINVPADKIDAYHKKLVEKGVKCSPSSATTTARSRQASRSRHRPSCARSTSTIPTASRSNSPPGPARWVPRPTSP